MRYLVLMTMLAISQSAVAVGAEPKSPPAPVKPTEWISVTEDVWGMFIEEAKFHFDQAQEYLAAKNTKAAAAEIRKSKTLLRLRQRSLAAAADDLDTLASEVEQGKIKTGKELEPIFQRAENALDQKQKMIPSFVEVSALLEDEGDYHFDRAKQELKKSDAKGAAAEIRKAATYWKTRAAQLKSRLSEATTKAISDLDSLANKVEKGAVKEVKELEKAFDGVRNRSQKAHETLTH